jgi:kumamolisin
LPALSRATAVSSGEEAGSQALTLTIVLRRDDQAGFEQYLRDVYDSRSLEYQRFLSLPEIIERFGPSHEAYMGILNYLQGHGFSLVEGSVTRQTLLVRGTREDAERAFDVQIRDYMLTDQRFYANDRNPRLPPGIGTHVQAVLGLSNLAQPQTITSLEKVALICSVAFAVLGATGIVTWWISGPVAAICLFLGFLPLFPQKLIPIPYNFPIPGLTGGQPLSTLVRPNTDKLSASAQVSVPTGAGQTIGITSFSDFDVNDVRDLIAYLGAAPEEINRLSRRSLNGGAPLGPGQVEPLLDIAAVMATAPGANIVVYDAPFTGAGTSFQSLFNAMIGDGVDIISNSWAYCEDQTTLADVASIDAILQTAAAAGISVFSGSGDYGSTCLNGSPNTVHVPASATYITAVGGTTLNYGPGFTYGSETWWDGAMATPPTGQGGFGVSQFFGRPAYQSALNPQAMRSVPDVAVNADPATGYILCQASDGGCPNGKLYGGTSVAAPIWAAFTALLNEAQGQNIGFLNPLIYPLAGTEAFNGAASMGSDFAHVGLGSPNLDVLYRLLNGISEGTPDAAVSEVLYAGSVITGVQTLPMTSLPADGASAGVIVVTIRDADGHTVSGTNVALAANSSNAMIAPAGTVTTDANGQAVFLVTSLTPGTVTLTATDATGNIPLSETADISFGVPPAASAGIGASPTSLLNDGVSATTITVTLKDALNRPSPGKLITLVQGSGRSVITGPNPSVTDANGEIRFTATNQFSETVTYTAVNVTDGDLPVPGNATVNFSGSANLSCVGNPPTAAAGYALTPFANGFFTQNLFFGNVNWGCSGASNPTFNTTNSVYVANFATGDLFKFGLGGGVVSTGNQLSNLGRTLGQPTFGKDGRLYATHGATTGNFTTGDIVEIDPATGAQLRVIAPNLTCPSSLAVDPLSGDLFFDNACTGAGSGNPSLFRVRNPGSATPIVEVYATLPTTMGNGAISFAPDGSIYVVINYFGNPNAPIVRVSGTDQPTPPTITTLPGITSNFWVTVGEANADGSAKSLIVLSPSGLALMDLASNATTPLTNGGIGSGVIGPDGCLYASATDTIYKLAPSSGGCGFVSTNPAPALTLSPATVSPNPAQGSQQTMTAQFVNLAAPEDTPVFFSIGGANAQTKFGRTDASGKATINYTGTFTGNDTVIASATVDVSDFTSNLARLTWDAGQHVTFLSLNTSPSGATVGIPVTLSAALVDVSVNPTAAIAGATVQFSVGGQSCSGVTNANGIVSCSVTLPAAGSFTLMANFAGGAQQQAAVASQTLFVTAPVTSPATCFTGTVASGGQATACLNSALPTCQFMSSAFVPVDNVGVAPPTGIQIPYGLFQFTTTGCSDTVNLSVTYPNPLPANTSYWKFGPTSGQPAHWYALPATINNSTLTVILTDGGAGDSDLQVNGRIVDPGGAGYAIATDGTDGVPIPTLNEWRLLLFMLLMAVMVSVAASRRRTGRF